jgi:hypothetical protein
MTWSTSYGREVAQHTIIIRIFHDVRVHNQLQAHQSFKLVIDIKIIKSLMQILNIK